MLQLLRDWLTGQGLSPTWVTVVHTAILAAGLLVLATAVHFVVRQIVVRVVGRIIRKTRTDWDDALVDRGVFKRAAHLAPAIVVHMLASVVFAPYPTLVDVAQTIALIYMIIIALSTLDRLTQAFLSIYERYEISKRIYLKGFVQVFKIVVYILGLVYVLASLIGKSPLVFFSGLGAFAAVFILVFRDAILGLVAGIQLMSNDMVRRGDWVEIPKYGVDGDVLDVALTTVTVQNWDKTIATVPTYALISESFRNWRGMNDSGGRRIKRSVSIDMNSVRFCDEEMITRFKKIQYISEYVEAKLKEVQEWNQEHKVDESNLANGRRLTNIGTFRAYLVAYLRNHPKVHQEMTFLVRHLPPSPTGIPIEVYVFSNDQVWANYEAIQADIFDHILAIIPLFDLRVFQEPTGQDLRALGGKAS